MTTLSLHTSKGRVSTAEMLVTNGFRTQNIQMQNQSRRQIHHNSLSPKETVRRISSWHVADPKIVWYALYQTPALHLPTLGAGLLSQGTQVKLWTRSKITNVHAETIAETSVACDPDIEAFPNTWLDNSVSQLNHSSPVRAISARLQLHQSQSCFGARRSTGLNRLNCSRKCCETPGNCVGSSRFWSMNMTLTRSKLVLLLA